ncbi:head-tail connector protein [Methylomonas sp. CM2]|uniref:head-tail connector protein n=1 Tax=Methylomonas sp. CM2 TaxID=3417647 RepID=UPI003CF3E29C
MPIKTPPTAEPLTLDELRAHLGMNTVDFTAAQDNLEVLLTTARLLAESNEGANFAIVSQTWVGHFDQFPGRACGAYPRDTLGGRVPYQIDLRSPLQSVTSITYLDTNGTRQTLESSEYAVDVVMCRVIPAYGKTWPDARTFPGSVQVEYVCGFGNQSAVPEDIKSAIKLMVGQNWRYQSTIESGFRPLDMPNASKQLLSGYKDYRPLHA